MVVPAFPGFGDGCGRYGFGNKIRKGVAVRLIGYARVSTSEQETDMQLAALKRAGVRTVFAEKGSSVGQRPALQRALGTMRPGDTLVVFKLDRIARSLLDLLGIIERMERARVGFRSLTEPIDTGSAAGRLMLQMLGAFAEFERSLIRERSMAGQAVAMQRGVHCGRPRSLAPEDEADAVRLYRTGHYTYQSLAMVFDSHPATIKRAVYRVARPGHSSLR